MNRFSVLTKTVFALSVVTIATGLLQMVAPSLVLHWVGTEISFATEYLFRIIGMFMVLFGGMTLHTLLVRSGVAVPMRWAAYQKFAAFLVMSLGVALHVFGMLALGVSVFDLMTGVIYLMWLHAWQEEVMHGSSRVGA